MVATGLVGLAATIATGLVGLAATIATGLVGLAATIATGLTGLRKLIQNLGRSNLKESPATWIRGGAGALV